MTPKAYPIGSRSNALLVIVAAAALAGVAGVLLTPWLALSGRAEMFAFALPFAVAIAVALAWNTHYGLCAAAFAIMPLGILQREFAGVTINLPEAIILALAAKELALLLAPPGRRSAVPLPWRSLLAFAAAALVAIGTGLLGGNGTIRVLQDFRQFTEYLALLWLVARRIESPAQAARLVGCFAAGSAIVAVHGIVQSLTGMGIPQDQALSDMIFHKGIRAGSFYGATPLGGLMVLSICPAIGAMMWTRPGVPKAFLALCIALCTVAIVYTKTRASWMGLAIALLFFLASIRLSPRVVLGAAIAALAVVVALGPLVAQRMATLSFSRNERSLLDRVDHYTTAAIILSEVPAFGLGWGAYYDMEKLLDNGRYVATPAPSRDAQATVHSAYLQIAVKTGLIGLGMFLLIPISWGIAVARERIRRRPGDPDYVLSAGIAAGVLGYLAHSGVENFFQWPVMAQSFWLMLGLSFALLNPRMPNKPQP